MTEITLYRRDFRVEPEDNADFFADICIQLGLASSYADADKYEEIKLRVEVVEAVQS